MAYRRSSSRRSVRRAPARKSARRGTKYQRAAPRQQTVRIVLETRHDAPSVDGGKVLPAREIATQKAKF